MNQWFDIRRLVLGVVLGCGLLWGLGLGLAVQARALDHVPGEVLVGYTHSSPKIAADVGRTMGVRLPAAPDPTGELIRLGRARNLWAEITRLRAIPGVAYAVPDYIAHQAGGYIPNDPGRGTSAGGWQQVQWNFLPGTGVNAPEAWANLIADHHPGGSGVIVAILDTGVAYRNWNQYKQSPDFTGTKFVDPHDFVANNAYPLDREGHGTFVAGTVAESTNNHIALTGLAYGASIMPVRILNAQGNGDAKTIAAGIRYAVGHGARVINLSLEFGLHVTAAEIPEIISALRYAHEKGVVVVAAAGNDSGTEVAEPARDAPVISVGATTKDGCLADYSNTGDTLDLVAPGGGDDANLSSDPDCHPDASEPDVFQETLLSPSNPTKFGLPRGWFGTSMSAPNVAATAALVIASGVIGSHPTPDAVLARLEQTAKQLGATKPNADFGYGLLDAGAATTKP